MKQFRRSEKNKATSFNRNSNNRNDDGSGLSVAQSIDINAPLDVVWSIIANVANYPSVLRDTTAVEPVLPTTNLNPVAVGAKYRQSIHRKRKYSVFVYTITAFQEPTTAAMKSSGNNKASTRCCCLGGASQNRGGDITSTQILEFFEDNTTRFVITCALIPRAWWSRCFLWCIQRFLLKEGQQAAQDICLDIKAAAEKVAAIEGS